MKVPLGFGLSSVHCGLKNKKLDLGIIFCRDLCAAAGFFTKNANVSYSVTLSRRNINKPVKAVLVNSGNANCFSHPQGLEDTEKILFAAAKELGVNKKNILIASTGIIGKKLAKEKIIKNIPVLIKGVSDSKEKIREFSRSILTTDTFEKVSYSRVSLSEGRDINILGFAKGAGMIYPNMATMLGFILTDADLSPICLRKIAKEAIEESFNSISIDACQSTNDTVFFLSSRKTALKNEREISKFSAAVKKICLDLAKMIIRDAEGASKFVEIHIKGARSLQEAKKSGLAIANSSLLKCALYGEDKNWGRIISALGQAQVKAGGDIAIKSTSLKKKDIKIVVDLKRGQAQWRVYTSDLTPRYVKINAGYS